MHIGQSGVPNLIFIGQSLMFDAEKMFKVHEKVIPTNREIKM